MPLKLLWLFAAAAGGGFLLGRSGPREPDVEHGRYIVHRLAHCVECHTPRAGDGELLASRLLRGAPVPVEAPPFPGWDWAARAPSIAGLPGWSDEDALSFFRTGIVPRLGRPARPPMPRFRMSERDARAVVAYLRSLP